MIGTGNKSLISQLGVAPKLQHFFVLRLLQVNNFSTQNLQLNTIPTPVLKYSCRKHMQLTRQ